MPYYANINNDAVSTVKLWFLVVWGLNLGPTVPVA